MKIAVTTPTGNIGSRLAGHLLDAGAQVTLLVRDPGKVASLVSRGANAVPGNLEDGAYVTRATAGVDVLFWLTPPDMGNPDFRGRQRKLGEIAGQAVRANRIPRVVHLSSVGAQMPSGTGPIAGLHQVENSLNESGAAVRHLRAAFFMENFLWSLDGIRAAGSVFMPISGSTRTSMIATRDIAASAAKVLLDGSWTGQKAVGLHGPADLSFDEAATALGEGLSRPVRHVTVTPDQARGAMVGMGVHPGVAALFLEMHDAFETGRLQIAEPRTPETTTPTTLTTFAREVMKPLL